MELSWLTKTKLLIVLVLGVVLLGVIGGSWTAPRDPLHPVRWDQFSWLGDLGLAGLALVAGFLGYFAAWPLGREAGVLTVPAGLAALGLHGGSMTVLMQGTDTLAGRQSLYASLRWEPLFWLALVGLGALGVRLASRLCPSHPTTVPEIHHETDHRAYGRGPAALFLSVLVGLVLIGACARNTPLTLASVATQPRSAQLAFALCVALGGAAFITRTCLNVGVVWTLLAMPALYAVGTLLYARSSVLGPITERFPATAYPHAILSVLPIQLVAFGSIGAVIGYWLAIRYRHWRRHECA